MTGHTISHYQILEKLGEGGMGVVYKARDTHLDRFVAIKVLPPEKVADPERKRRFVQEAKAASALNHPNIITIYDIDSADGVEFIAMEYVAGKTLDELIPRKGMRLNEVLKHSVEIADALAKAHSVGIIHRDLKPGNVMVGEDGRVKVLDFGLAKLTEAVPLSEDEATRTMKPTTEEGKVVGTVSYMSPEQAEGRSVDARSDIFAFGSVLYEMVSGRQAFRGNTKVSTVAAIIKEEPAPLAAEVPRDLQKLITRCLRKDPERRFHHMVDVRVALAELKEESDSGKLAAAPAPARQRKRPFLWPAVAAVAVIVLAAAGVVVWQRMQAKPLTERDWIVLADFINTTGDTVFDSTLRQALAIQLEQSPFLKIMGDEQMHQDLRLMGRPAGERVTNQIAREICRREGEKAMVHGSIENLGKSYAITLQATNCQTGEALAREQVEAEDKEHVLQAVATAAKGMRAKLGESLTSIQKLDVPNQQVTTTSLEAFQAFALGMEQVFSGSLLATIPFFQRAAELDPNFALAYVGLGAVYGAAGESGRLAEYYRKAFGLVDRVSERERLTISILYYQEVTGDLDKAVDALQFYARTYPRALEPHNSLGILYGSTGEWEKALSELQEAVRLDPRAFAPYINLVYPYSYLDRFDEAKAVAEKAFAQKLDAALIHRNLLRIAHIQGDRAEAEKQIQWLAGRPEEYMSLDVQAENAAALGQLRTTERLFGRAAEMVRRRGLPETEARFQADRALWEALVGNCEATRGKAHAADLPEQGPADTLTAALPLALCGDAAAAQKAVDETSKRYPIHTIWNAVHLPSIRAAIELSRNQPEKAVELLQSATPYERAYPHAVYLRGLAYLRTRKGAEAAAEFRKILDHKGANWGPYYPLSYVGLARAQALAGNTSEARKAYQDFLALWKDADPDIPILKEARQEYARLK